MIVHKKNSKKLGFDILHHAGFFFFNWDSLHARLKATTRPGITRKKAQKRLQETENLFRKNLQLKDVC